MSDKPKSLLDVMKQALDKKQQRNRPGAKNIDTDVKAPGHAAVPVSKPQKKVTGRGR